MHTPIKGPRTKHLSGKSNKKPEHRSYSDGYANRDGFKTERLRNDRNTNAIGFTANLVADEYDDE